MLILTIETCTDMSTMGLVRDGAVLIEAAFPSRYTLAKRMLVRLEWMLEECGLNKHDLQAIAVSLGPGSFTGVRIGAAAAKTLALGLQIPVVGVPTLEAIAYPFREMRDALLVPVINARRQQIYTAIFRGEDSLLRRETADTLLSAEPFAELLAPHQAHAASTLFIGLTDGLPAAFRDGLAKPVAAVRGLVTPTALALLAEEKLARGETDDAMTLAPIYLRSAAD